MQCWFIVPRKSAELLACILWIVLLNVHGVGHCCRLCGMSFVLFLRPEEVMLLPDEFVA